MYMIFNYPDIIAIFVLIFIYKANENLSNFLSNSLL